MRVVRSTSLSRVVGGCGSGTRRGGAFFRSTPLLAAAAAQAAPQEALSSAAAAAEFGDPMKYLLRILASRSDGIRAATAYYANEIKPLLRQRMSESSAREREGGKETPLGDARVLSFLAQSRWQEFAILLMKILCDAKRLEDVRLLFALCLREAWTPKTDVFSVLLMGISSSDTFTEDEVDQVWALMKERGVERDVVCDVCFLHLYLRLGRTDFERQQWPSIRDRIQGTLIRHMSDPRQHVLPVGFTTKLSHCFTVMTRVSCNQDHPWELLAILEPFRSFRVRSVGAIGAAELLPAHVVLTATQLLTFLSLSLNNEEVSSRQLRLLFESLLHQYDHEYQMFYAPSPQHRRNVVDGEPSEPKPSQASLKGDDGATRALSSESELAPSGTRNSTSLAIGEPHGGAVLGDGSAGSTALVISSSSSGGSRSHALQLMFQTANAVAEFNVFRLLSRCIRDADLDFAQKLATYARERSVFSNSETKSIFSLGLVQIHALVALSSELPRHERVERLLTMLRVLDEDCVEPHCSPAALSSALTVVTPTIDGSAQHSVLVSPKVTSSVCRRALTYGGEDLLLAVVENHLSATTSAIAPQRGAPPTWRSILRLVDALGCLGCGPALESLLSHARKTCGLTVTAEVYEAVGSAMLDVGGGAVRFSCKDDPLGQWMSLVEKMMNESQSTVSGFSPTHGSTGESDTSASFLRPTPSMLSAGLRFAVARGDVSNAMKIVRIHVECGTPMNRALVGQLARHLCYIVDLEGVRTLLDAADVLNGGAEPAVKNMCAKVAAKYGQGNGGVQQR